MDFNDSWKQQHFLKAPYKPVGDVPQIRFIA